MQRFDLVSGWTLIVGVTLLEDGLYEADGFAVTYRQGIRRGSQVSGSKVHVYTEGNEP